MHTNIATDVYFHIIIVYFAAEGKIQISVT